MNTPEVDFCCGQYITDIVNILKMTTNGLLNDKTDHYVKKFSFEIFTFSDWAFFSSYFDITFKSFWHFFIYIVCSLLVFFLNASKSSVPNYGIFIIDHRKYRFYTVNVKWQIVWGFFRQKSVYEQVFELNYLRLLIWYSSDLWY